VNFLFKIFREIKNFNFFKENLIFLEKMVVVKLIVIVLVLLFRMSVVDSDASSSSVIQRLIVRLDDPSSHPSSDNCTLFKQIEVRFFSNFDEIFPGISGVFWLKQ
jgi:hypothetical protein